ncbi:hypothetical protein OGV25_08845 [Pseudomonas sp. P1B16]|uniref:hypothetical protein n=1 Tax=Pseudomonas sp. P1B16 TaxID=2986074 RepID=UPI002A239E1A|nr:hypothetical protein [Pseudomonas sp. P1B16]WPM28238.1 hypothetical protein OGV25_08845 [Pseudomonas sp. P1B16]
MAVRYFLVGNFAPLFAPPISAAGSSKILSRQNLRALAPAHAERRLAEKWGDLMVRIPAFPLLILIKALIFRGFFVVRQAWRVARQRNQFGCGGLTGDLVVKVL